MAKKAKRMKSSPDKPIFSGNGAKSKTADGFRNFAMKLGVGNRGEDGCEDNVISGGHYQFNLVTRNRIQLEAAYRGSWIVGRVIDCVAEDMTKAGVILNTNDGAEKVQDFKAEMSRLQIWQSVQDTTKWGRLYGGAIGVLQIDGQDLGTPLDLDTIEKDQFLGIAVYDRWQLNPVLSKIIEDGPMLGLPAYYDIVLGSNLNNPGQVPGGQSQTKSGEQTVNPETAAHVRVHYSRCFRMGGHKLPFFQAITEMMWDESVLERLWDRLIEFDTATASAGGLIGRALLRTVGVDGLREILSAGGEAQQALVSMFEYMRQFQTSEGLTLLDKNDDFQTTAYSFAGLSDVLIQFGQQVSGSAEIPLVRLFGQSPVGLNATGDADIRNYYDSINAKQESQLRNPMETIIEVVWRSKFGEAAPDDLTFTFTPLWQMSALDKSTITTNQTNAVIAAHESGLIKTSTAMKELKQSSADTGVFTHITDEEIQEAQDEPPPMAEVDPDEPNAGVGDPGQGPSEPKEVVKKAAKDSAWKAFQKLFRRHKQVDSKPKEMSADQKTIAEWLAK